MPRGARDCSVDQTGLPDGGRPQGTERNSGTILFGDENVTDDKSGLASASYRVFSDMNPFQGAILAVAATALAIPLGEPRFVRFQLADGVQVTGEMTAWDAEGFDGSFGQRRWSELSHGETWRLYVQVMDQNDAGQWVDLGGLMLVEEDGGQWAERAFCRALRIDPDAASAVAAARDKAESDRLHRRLVQEAIETQRLALASPEAADWPATPWPAGDPPDPAAAVQTLRREAEQILRKAGLKLEPLETERFLVYADLPALDRARLAARLDAVYDYLADLLWVDGNLFWGKAVVIHLADPDRFRLLEAESFNQVVVRYSSGICHPMGPRVFINLTGEVESDALSSALAVATVHAFMHRYRSPRRPPPWANEGLAHHVAAEVFGGRIAEIVRGQGVDDVRLPVDIEAIFTASYDNGWSGRDGAGPAVGALLVELMISQRPVGFRQWINAVKDGKDWTTALAEDYGVPAPRLLETFIQYYRVND